MKTDELREKYLEFFQSKGHQLCASDVLVPRWDKSVLFTPAGMNQFKDHFLGKVELEFTRATSCQKCLRTGDIENVGRTAYHHTFFEMLGNFSFGDYFKREAIQWAWEFLTDKKYLAIDPERLSVTVYKDDDEAAKIWTDEIGVGNRITREDEDENFWPASAPSLGPDGVCGPCSEIYFTPDDGNTVEIWNLVFTQFNRSGDPPNNLEPLPSKNIDTGMGLERIAATLQGVTTNYHIDTLLPIVEAAAQVCSMKYEPDSENGRRLRRITDHVRACTFCIHENVYPGAKKDEYVVKRLLRRAVLDGHQMGLRAPFLFQLVSSVAEQMSRPYPELSETSERVAKVIEKEENNFFETIDDGIARVQKLISDIQSTGKTTIDGALAAGVYTTHGVPPELFETLGEQNSLSLDWEGFNVAMSQHGQASGVIADSVMGNFGPIDEIKSEAKSTPFLGYEKTTATAKIVALVGDNQRLDSLGPFEKSTPGGGAGQGSHSSDGNASDQIVVLDRSPFYAESGGQVGDTGMITTEAGKFQVNNTQKNGDLILHLGQVIEGSIGSGQSATATVTESRRNAIRRAHSATHILHYALQKNLGTHAQQRGSKVTDDNLRFDFSNLEPVSSELLTEIEAESNRRVEDAVTIKAEILPLSEARSQGAMMLFGEKYPDPVRMVSMGEFSKELCGGTHLQNTSEVLAFEIVSEEGVAAGTRRITALTGEKALEHQRFISEALSQSAKTLGSPAGGLVNAIKQLSDEIRKLKKSVASGSQPASKETARTPSSDAEQTKLNYWQERALLREAAKVINAPPLELPARISALLEERTTLSEQLEKLADGPAVDADSLIQSSFEANGTHVVVSEIPGGNANLMRNLIDQIRKKTDASATFLISSPAADKVILVAGVSKDLVDQGISAGDWVKDIAPVVGGGGGGRPDMAQAGGKQPENIKPALDRARDYMRAQLAT